MTENISNCIDSIQSNAQSQKDHAEVMDMPILRDKMDDIIKQCSELRRAIEVNDKVIEHNGYMSAMNKAQDLVDKHFKPINNKK
jgi:flagellar hook-basal body complex protein FliE